MKTDKPKFIVYKAKCESVYQVGNMSECIYQLEDAIYYSTSDKVEDLELVSKKTYDTAVEQLEQKIKKYEENFDLNLVAKLEQKLTAAEARVKELEDKLTALNCSPNTVNADLQRAFEKEHSKAEILKKKLSSQESKFNDILKVCNNNTQYMWAAKIVSIITGCDFRDSEYILREHLTKKDE